MVSPEPNVGKVQDGQQGEPPLNAINDDRLASFSYNASTLSATSQITEKLCDGLLNW